MQRHGRRPCPAGARETERETEREAETEIGTEVEAEGHVRAEQGAPSVIDIELHTPHHVTVGYVGQPGERTFFLQAQEEDTTLTLLLEKAQVEAMGELLAQLLARVDDRPATDWDRSAMELRAPIDPRWRIGEIALGLDPDAERFALEVTEFVSQDGDEPDDEPDDVDPLEARIWADRDQTRRLAAHASEIVGQGRPRCQLCGRPTETDGAHVCPATNGHGRLER